MRELNDTEKALGIVYYKDAYSWDVGVVPGVDPVVRALPIEELPDTEEAFGVPSSTEAFTFQIWKGRQAFRRSGGDYPARVRS